MKAPVLGLGGVFALLLGEIAAAIGGAAGRPRTALTQLQAAGG